MDAALAALGRAGILKVALVAFRANEAGNAFWESSALRSARIWSTATEAYGAQYLKVWEEGCL